jgi:hypothetical protein
MYIFIRRGEKIGRPGIDGRKKLIYGLKCVMIMWTLFMKFEIGTN